MAMGCVYYYYINLGLDQGFDTLSRVCTGTDRGADTQPVLAVLAGEWVYARLGNILDRYHTLQRATAIDHQQALDAMDVE